MGRGGVAGVDVGDRWELRVSFWANVLSQFLGDLCAGGILVWVAVRWEARLDEGREDRHGR